MSPPVSEKNTITVIQNDMPHWPMKRGNHSPEIYPPFFYSCLDQKSSQDMFRWKNDKHILAQLHIGQFLLDESEYPLGSAHHSPAPRTACKRMTGTSGPTLVYWRIVASLAGAIVAFPVLTSKSL